MVVPIPKRDTNKLFDQYFSKKLLVSEEILSCGVGASLPPPDPPIVYLPKKAMHIGAGVR